MIAVEATTFTGQIYDQLLPHAEKLKVAHPLMLRASAAAKRKNDGIDAGSPTASAAISCPRATWHRPRSATGDLSCATAVWCCAKRCRIRTAIGPADGDRGEHNTSCARTAWATWL